MQSGLTLEGKVLTAPTKPIEVSSDDYVLIHYKKKQDAAETTYIFVRRGSFESLFVQEFLGVKEEDEILDDSQILDLLKQLHVNPYFGFGAEDDEVFLHTNLGRIVRKEPKSEPEYN